MRQLCGAIPKIAMFLLFLGCSYEIMGSVGNVLLPSGVELSGGSFVFEEDTFVLDNRHFLVDASFSQQISSDFVFDTFQEACAHLIDGDPSDPMIVYLAPSVYWVDNPDDTTVVAAENGRGPFGMIVKCQFLHLKGLSENPENVVLASQRGQTQGADGNFTMFDFWGDGLEVSNLTMGNYCNVDLEYPLNPSLGRKKRSSAITQAHVAYCHGDKVVARNVRFISRLNMNPLNGARRILFEYCHMECTDDALTGNGVYLHCDFDFYGQKPFYTTHSAGAVFIDCDFRLMCDNTESYFCKADGPLTLIDCRIHSEKICELNWTAYPHRYTRCYQSGVTMNGIPYIVGEKSGNTVLLDNKQILSIYKENGNYRVAPLLAGDDGWNPLNESMLPPESCANSLHLNPQRVSVETGGDPAILKVSLMRHGGFPVLPGDTSMTWQVEKDFCSVVHLVPSIGGECMVYSTYDGDEPVSCCVTVSLENGLVGAAELILSGSKLAPPILIGKPKIVMGKSKAHLEYEIDTDGKRDVSHINWYRCRSKDGAGAVIVSEGRSASNVDYALTSADNGWFLMAELIPQSVRSVAASPVKVISRKKIVISKKAQNEILDTDFSDFPCEWQPLVIPGFWSVDGFKPEDTSQYDWSFDTNEPMWRYGQGFNGAVGKGLMQAQRGARLRYTPVREHKGDMSLSLYVDPAKTAGQGFGSATGQYMDVCLKFDTNTLTGYGLRIIRTVKYANAVDFYLVGYNHGIVVPLTEPVSSICYRTGCLINLSFVGNILKADITTSTPLSIPSDNKLSTSVHLSANVEGNPFGGVQIQHTGSCGESVTMLHHLKAEWE